MRRSYFDRAQAPYKRLRYLDRINIDTTKYYMDIDGNMRVPAVIARAGVLNYTYIDDKGQRIDVSEAKLPEEILSKSTIFSAAGKPLTDEHPPEMINPGNYHKYVKGVFIQPKAVGDAIHGDLVIYDKEIQDEIKAGKRYQLSPGFWSATEYTEGSYKGKSYDAVQRDISINHIALVEEGRAGDGVKIKLDSAQMQNIVDEVKSMKVSRFDVDTEEEKKIDEYEENKMKSEQDQEEEEKKMTDQMPDEEKKEDQEAENPEDEKKVTDILGELPEEVVDLISQLKTENDMLKNEMTKTDSRSTAEYMEARDFAMKHVTDSALDPYNNDIEYYKRAVVEASGYKAGKLDSAQLKGAYAVAKMALKKSHAVTGHEPREDSRYKSELERALEESEKNNMAFSGRREVSR